MTHLVTRSQLARVTSFINRFRSLKPLLTTTISRSQTLSFAQYSTKTTSSADSDHRPAALPEELSKNVVVLSCESSAEGGVCDVYVVGTCHVSEESARRVQAIVKFLKPQVVFLELCSRRKGTLTRREFKVPTVEQVIEMLKKKQNILGVLISYYIAMVGRELGVVPGSEFRVAYEEAIKYGGSVVLGDRPIQITLTRTSRAWSNMPLWHKAKVFSISPKFLDLDKMLKEVEDSDSDLIASLVQEICKKFPTLAETMIHERDRYMSSALLKVARKSSSVVAVVGLGHLQGIEKHWKQPVAVEDLLTVPSPESPNSALRIFKSVGFAAVGVAIISGIYLSRGGV